MINAARDSAKSGENIVKPIVDKLEVVARNWDRVAQPIQLSAKARGIDHDPSIDIAHSIRSLAIYLFNEHDMLDQTQRLNGLIQDIFAELPEVVERVDEDSDTLEEILQDRLHVEEQKKNEEEEWARNITYRAEVGLIFKDILSISPDGIIWKKHHFPLESITHVRWGAVRNSTNGIPTGTSYFIAFGDKCSEAVAELNKESIFSAFIEKLWLAVGIRLTTELIEKLQAGNEVRFGEATLRDDGVTLIKHKFLGANEQIRCSWQQVNVWAADGAFFIGSSDDKKTYAGLSYIHADNAHVLEFLIRTAFKKPNMRRLSDVLR